MECSDIITGPTTSACETQSKTGRVPERNEDRRSLPTSFGFTQGSLHQAGLSFLLILGPFRLFTCWVHCWRFLPLRVGFILTTITVRMLCSVEQNHVFWVLNQSSASRSAVLNNTYILTWSCLLKNWFPYLSHLFICIICSSVVHQRINRKQTKASCSLSRIDDGLVTLRPLGNTFTTLTYLRTNVLLNVDTKSPRVVCSLCFQPSMSPDVLTEVNQNSASCHE